MQTTEEAPQMTALEEYRPVAAGLAELQKRYGSLVFDCRTAAGDRQAREARRELVTLRTSLEDMRKALKAPALERSRLIDAEAKRIEAAIRAVEAPIDDQIRAVEQEKEAERERKRQEEAEKIAAVRRYIIETFSRPAGDAQFTAAQLRELLARYETEPVNAERFGDLVIEAQEHKLQAIERTQQAISDRMQREAEAAELARQRAEFVEQQRAETARRAEERKAEDASRAAREAAERESREAERRQIEAERAALAEQRAEQERAAREIAEAQQQRVAAEKAEAMRDAARLGALQAKAEEMHGVLLAWRLLDQIYAATPPSLQLATLRSHRDALLDSLTPKEST